MEDVKRLVALALESRSSKDKSLNRDLSKGANRYTEHYAYPHIIPLSNRQNERRMLRIAALIAMSNVKQNNDKSFGTWARDNASNNTEYRMLRLTNLNFDQVVAEIARILRSINVSEKDAGFNWYDLAATLFYWGKGVTTESLKTRQKILKDFYRVEYKKEDNTESLNSDKNEESSDLNNGK